MVSVQYLRGPGGRREGGNEILYSPLLKPYFVLLSKPGTLRHFQEKSPEISSLLANSPALRTIYSQVRSHIALAIPCPESSRVE